MYLLQIAAGPIAAIPILDTFAYAFRQSDFFARTVVVLLVVLSMISWIIMLEKIAAVRHAIRGNRRFLKSFYSISGSPLQLALQLENFSGPLPLVYESAVKELMVALDLDPNFLDTYARKPSLPRPLSPGEIDKIRSALERTTDHVMFDLEKRLGLLGTTVTLSPFLGLLGTVWGVMLTFCQMANKGRPDIRAMAPGVSGALLTTVVGLLVAIPAVVGYNLLTHALRRISVEMENFIDDFTAVLRVEAGKESPNPRQSPAAEEA